MARARAAGGARARLQVELGRDAHVERAVEVVVVRDEGPRGRAAGDHVHHRRLDLEEAALVEEAAHARDDGRARAEGRRDARVGDQVEVTLAVARLLVGQPRMRAGRHVEAGREDRELGREDRELTALGLARVPRDADDVAALDAVEEALEARERLALAAAKVARVGDDLDLGALGAEVEEDEARARGAERGDAPRDRDALALELRARLERRARGDEGGQALRDVELVGVRVLAARLGRLDRAHAALVVARGVDLLRRIVEQAAGRAVLALGGLGRGALRGGGRLLGLRFSEGAVGRSASRAASAASARR